MRWSSAFSLFALLALLAGCGARAAGIAGTASTDGIGFAAAKSVLKEAGVVWIDDPREIVADQTAYDQALARIGAQMAVGDRPAETRVWLVAYSGRYVTVPRDPTYDILGPYTGCVTIIFDLRGTLLSIGNECPGPPSTATPTPFATPSPTYTPTATSTPRSAPTPPHGPLPAPFWAVQAPDFGFRFEDLSCGESILDTFVGTYATDVDIDPRTTVTVPMQFSDAQMTDIYEKLLEIGFWSYQPNFEPTPPTPGTGVYVVPTAHYRILVRNSGVEQSVDWVVRYVAPRMPADENLLSLIELIEDLIRSHPKYQRIPKPNFGCA